MTKPTRLFDCLTWQQERYPQTDMLAAKEKGNWRTWATSEVMATVLRLSAGLQAKSVSGNDGSVDAQDKIAIISNNRPEWLITDLAVQQLGAALVPIYPTTNPSEIEFILREASVKIIFVSNKELYEKINGVRTALPQTLEIYSFDDLPAVNHWSSLLKDPDEATRKQLAATAAAIPDTQLATIIYTSGTTGVPKGVMLSHRNILSNVMYCKESFPFEDRPDWKALSFLPLNHIFEKMVSYIYLFSGISIYYAESLDTIGANLIEVKPDLFCTVPRLLEKVYERIMAKGAALTGAKKQLFFWAVELGKKYDNNIPGNAWYRWQLALANKLIFSKWREALGNNLSLIVTGGAACQERLLRIFSSAGIPIFEGYGPTENSPVIAVNRRGKGLTKFGTVGPVLSGVECKLEADGEIVVRGRGMMMGYYKRPDLTAETIIDGWLHTGDIGVMEDGKFLRITDRKKELFKTSGGKYVAPSAIENKMKESRFIEQIMVVGPGRKFVGALIVPSFTQLADWCKTQNLSTASHETMLGHPEVKTMYQGIVDQFNTFFNHVEQVKKFSLLPVDWGIESGELTPKMSIRRKIINEKYQTAIESLYS